MMASPTLPAAVQRAVHVRLAPEEAFALFTQHLADWWPLASHSCSGDARASVRFEPRVGGAVTEWGTDGRQHPWGTLTEWNPPLGFAMHWHPGQVAQEATLLRVRFESAEGGTRVLVHHDGWQARGSAAPALRDDYDNGWPLVLQALAEAALKARRPG